MNSRYFALHFDFRKWPFHQPYAFHIFLLVRRNQNVAQSDDPTTAHGSLKQIHQITESTSISFSWYWIAQVPEYHDLATPFSESKKTDLTKGKGYPFLINSVIKSIHHNKN